MSSVDAGGAHRPPPTVFLSYASEDRAAARVLGDALPAFGLEVWYDESELGGGDLWDQKIRRQIRECDYFMPLVSAQTEARHEGYFRREWRLAVERTLDMADDHPFLLPIVIDDTNQSAARVPEKFLAAQWLRVPGGRPTPALEALCRRIVSGEAIAAPPARKTSVRAGGGGSPSPIGGSPLPVGGSPSPAPAETYPFPREEPGQRVQFWFAVAGWACRSGWAVFKRVPRWIRIIIYIWLCFALLSLCSTRHHSSPKTPPPSVMTPASLDKLKAISDEYRASGRSNAADIAKMSAQIAREFSGGVEEGAGTHSPLLAIPFTAPAGDAAAKKLADSAFAMSYGMAASSHRGLVGLSKEPVLSPDFAAALE
ncbi:MAG: toll/interleukin-1 receptor domain-containing protein, partial [Steroidobacteraceae bacterium]